MKIKVVDAPGYADFEAELIATIMSVDDRWLSYVISTDGYSALVPEVCIHPLEDDVT